MSELIDNHAKRIQTLKGIIRQLHRGVDPAEVQSQLRALVGQTHPGEIAAMEQELMAEGMTVEEVKSMCDLHATVVQEILSGPQQATAVPAGHPVDTFRRENVALREAVSRMRLAISESTALPPDAGAGDARLRLRRELNDLMEVDKHYRRKENLLFSCLERHGITGPSKVMWAKDDDVRALLKGFEQALGPTPPSADELATVFARVAEPALQALSGMIDKEENILLPMALQTLTEEEWGEIWQQSPEYGWCLVEPRSGYTAPSPATPELTVDLPRGRAIQFPTGSLNFEQLSAIFSTLPVDLTFVDADDRVRFFSEGPERIFPRSKAVIGRKVQHCHPPASVDVVERILGDFRAGRQNVAEFWINLRGKFVHIRYFAARDPQGQYLGTLEVTQDLTPLRALAGERRLLQYDAPLAAIGS